MIYQHTKICEDVSIGKKNGSFFSFWLLKKLDCFVWNQNHNRIDNSEMRGLGVGNGSWDREYNGPRAREKLVALILLLYNISCSLYNEMN